MTDPDEAVDLTAVRADDQLVEDLRRGAQPAAGDELGEVLAHLRDSSR